jgi:hypothetical protein
VKRGIQPVVTRLTAALCATVSVASAPDLRLVGAVRAGDTQAVRSLLAERVDVNAAEADGATAIAWAAHRDDLEVADLLIAAGANVNAANDYGVTPLSLACTNGSAAMVERLLKAGADPNAARPSGETPIMTAARGRCRSATPPSAGCWSSAAPTCARARRGGSRRCCSPRSREISNPRARCSGPAPT